MQSGKREAAVVRMPFCTECSSAGRPFAVQSWITASELRNASRLKFDETGMFNEATCASQVIFASMASTRRVPHFSAPRPSERPKLGHDLR